MHISALIQPAASSDKSSVSSNGVPILILANNDSSGDEADKSKPKENNIANVARAIKENCSRGVPRASCRFSLVNPGGRLVGLSWSV